MGFPGRVRTQERRNVSFFIYYRRLNVVKVRDAFPISHMDDCINSLGDSNKFTTLDYNGGYWQIPVTQEDRETTFISDEGLYRFTCLPFGLKNTPGTFQREADSTCAQVKWEFVVVYLYDIIVYTDTASENFTHLREVMSLSMHAYLTINLKI